MYRELSPGVYKHHQAGREVETLPIGTYEVKYNANYGYYYVQQRKDFELPENLIEFSDYKGDYIINMWDKVQRNTGTLLHGLKGTGKSVDAKRMCIRCIDMGIPVLCVSSAFSGIEFEQFLANIKQRFVCFIDEFDKKYSAKGVEEEGRGLVSSQSLLSLMDGKYDSNILFILTSNNANIGAYLSNRPGRIRYKISYGGLTTDTIKEFANQYLNNKDYIQSLLIACDVLGDISVDVLMTLIEESNLSETNPVSCIDILNVDKGSTDYYIQYIKDDIVVKEERFLSHPLTEIKHRYNFSEYAYTKDKDIDSTDYAGNVDFTELEVINKNDEYYIENIELKKRWSEETNTFNIRMYKKEVKKFNWNNIIL